MIVVVCASRASATDRETPIGPARHLPDPRGLEVVTETRERGVVIRLRGSLRARTAPALRDAVTAALTAPVRPPDTVVVDLAAVVADDDLGLWVLPAMAGDLERAGSALVIAVPARGLRARLRRLGARQLEITEVAPALDGVAVTRRDAGDRRGRSPRGEATG